MRLKIELDLTGRMLEHFQSQLVDHGGLYETAGEYLRELIRDDLQRQHGNKVLLDHLKPAASIPQAEKDLSQIQELINAVEGEFHF